MIDCPRCGEDNKADSDFCGYCGWAFMSNWHLCPDCNQTLKAAERCRMCISSSESDPKDLDDWYKLAEGAQ
jgi:predicted amidophosphoribosyltransferase